MRFAQLTVGAAALAAAAAFTAPAHAALPFPAIGIYKGSVTEATEVSNITVEGLPDAVLLGRINDFIPTDPAYNCLIGGSYNVWRAPSAYGQAFIVHNGWQGSQCAYGTWVFLVSPPV